jgi:hypothetical protein
VLVRDLLGWSSLSLAICAFSQGFEAVPLSLRRKKKSRFFHANTKSLRRFRRMKEAIKGSFEFRVG